MKIFVNIIPILIFTWSFNNEFPKNLTDQNSTTALEEKWNKDFNGLWINKDDKTRSITKCNVRYDNNQFHVQIWGACVPQDCEWGERASGEVEKEANKFDLSWDHGFVESSFSFLIINGELKLTERGKYKDNSGRTDYERIEYFVKQ